MIKKSIALSVIIILTLFLCQLNALTYFRVLVEGEISDTLVQGQSYSFEVGVDPLSTALFFFVEDLNNNSVIDPEETPLLPPYEHVKFQDNLYILPDSGAFYIDSDSTEGQIYIHDFFYILWVGNYILFCYDETDTFFQPFHVLPPDTVTMSVSGRIIFEGITPPNPLLSSFLLLGGIEVSEDPVVMLFNPDSFGDFSFNWLGDPGTVFLNFTGSDPILYEDIIYDIEDLNYEVYVDGHETGVEVWVRAYYPDTAVFHGYIVSSEGEPVTADSLFVVYPDGVGWCGYMDTFYVSAEDGYFGLNIVMDRCTHMQGYFDYYKVPHDFLTPFTGWYLAFSPEMSLEFEYNDTLFVINDSIWVSYTYERSTAPFEIDLPVKVNNYNYGYTNALVPYDSNLAIGIYWDDSIGADNPWYELTLDCEDCLPENYSLYGGRNYWVTAGDSIELVIGEMRSFISGTLFSAAGGRIFETTLLKLHQYSGYGSFSGSSYDIPIVDGIYENAPLFSDTLYWLEIDSIDGYMYSINDHRSFPSGHHTVNFSLYPTDAYFLLYLEIDSSDPMDDAFHVKLYSPEDDAMYSKRVVKNRWVSFPIYSGFDEPCRLLIANLAYGGFPPPLVRLVENNGNIPVEAGDSIRITMEVPIDYFIMEFVEDPADAWQHSLSTASLNICYYSREDTHLIYSYVPNYDSGMSLNLPIFSEPMLVRPESPFWFDLHYFIANPDEYLIVGGAYRPDHVTRYFNKGSGEMLLSLDGYPADYLGDDTIFLPRGDFSGVEIPEYPDHHYIADLFLFRTDMFHHPYGDGSVMAFHDVCDGEWTVVLPESLPGGFVPAVTETTFYVEDMSIYPDEWQEFPIAIPVKSPAGVHGYVNRELRFFEANLIQADFYVQGTDSLAVSARAWQYYPWGPPSILAKYYIKNTELPPNDYYLQLSFTGWTVEEPIIYPEQIEFSYTGDSLLLPDSYIAMTRGWAHVSVTGLDAEMYDGSYVHYYIHPDSVHEDIDFYDLDVSYPFPELGSVLTLKLPAGSWIVKPVVPLGWLPTPAETVLKVPVYSDTLQRYFIDFDYSVVEETGGLMGNFVTDTDDPSPVSLDNCQITLYGPDGVTSIAETSADESGYFSLFDLAAPAEYYFGVDHELGSILFVDNNMREVEISPSDTLELPNIYVDNGNATVRVNFVNTDVDYIDFTSLRLRVSGVPSLPEDVYVPYTPHRRSGTFYLCDGVWTVCAPEIPGVVFTPIETTIVVSEAIETHEINFVNVLSVDKDPVLPYDFSIDAYPNPFNGVLNIEFSIPRLSPVSLVVFDVRGREAALLIEERLPEGRYSIKWNCGESVSSGVYFLLLRTGRQSKLLKRIYLK